MSSRVRVLLAVVACLGVTARVQAAPVLFEWSVNQDGTVKDSLAGDVLPANWSMAGFDLTSGLGTIVATLTGAGPHQVLLFVDHEIDESLNTFFNELGATSGAAATGQSWEIDEPGYTDPPGDIYTNFLAGALDNTNAIPVGTANDVSMALGWDFSLEPGETALIRFVVHTAPPAGGFYLRQIDPDSETSLYFSSTLQTRGGDDIPEPAILLLLGLGLTLGSRRLRRH